MDIRDAAPSDWPSIYPIFAAVVNAGRTYAYPPDLSSDAARRLWLGQERTVVAEIDGRIVGTAIMGPNRPGRGSHIATASFMVSPDAQGQGVGRALGIHMVDWAMTRGYRGIQFNAVVETNEPAVRLWRSLGFDVLGTVPGAFEHPEQGFVGLHIMFRSLTAGEPAGSDGVPAEPK
ncbi:GNAT superfamily N-acetyltransferase [Cryobacterium sp. MP_M5]|uniref:GNAT family N-acetyltransferase n=1 Tax=unclassified Cryobacterium TaxID=2649013 RepID=UPI0018C95BB3|nr:MULTISPECIES: GNAT family N-acetyltransferase [unclassified Cryobacterium]MBG6059863.1 GNAT superfamily N-acetyltransferase [Cryobacterium sp. MP_M3]MEC5178235.1 GNAT superfamily N-acetyltransferase [Cryobacterium sp. MP_M5]